VSVASIDALYRRHARAMVTFFARRTLDAEAAVDLVAETFATAIEEQTRFRGTTEAEQAGWLYGIARNHLSGWYRRAGVERRALRKVGLEPPALTDADVERIEDLAEFAELRPRVASALAGLPSETREALRLRVVEELSYRETAVLLGIAEPAARARVSRGLRTLAALLDQDDERLEVKGA